MHAYPHDVRFVGIPGIFVQHYIADINDWLEHFESRGPELKLWLRRDPTGTPHLIGDGSDKTPMVPIIRNIVTLKAVRLRAFRQRTLIVTPSDSKTARIISKHSNDLQDLYDVGEPKKWEMPV